MTRDTASDIDLLCTQARSAARRLAGLPDETRRDALIAGAEHLRARSGDISSANAADLEAAAQAGLSSAMIDRLELNRPRIEAMAAGLETVAALPDPLGETIAQWTAPSGLLITQTRIPIGVVAVIYESRPNVTADVSALCIRSGNAAILKGGKEAIHSNGMIADVLTEAFSACGLPSSALQLVRSTEREATTALLGRDDAIDVVVPRGGPGLVRAVAENARVPVIKHYEGVCHVYVDRHADLSTAEEIAFNAKVRRPGVCNAMETLVVHSDVAAPFLAALGPRLQDAGVELRADERATELLEGARPATPEDWTTEYLDLILAVKIVDSVDEAIDFINDNGSGHSDCICTADQESADRFLAGVDSAVVYQNASTRFTDGYEFGFGAEVGISTNRIHARGPMGLRELTTYKYLVHGDGQIR